LTIGLELTLVGSELPRLRSSEVLLRTPEPRNHGTPGTCARQSLSHPH